MPIRPSSFFVLRTPLLPIDDFLNWSVSAQLACDNASPSARGEKEWRIALERGRAILRSRLQVPAVQQALHVASPSLTTGLAYWLKDPDSKKGLQAERAVVRYFARMCSRCTPFGLFSACSLGDIYPVGENPGTSLVLSALSTYRLTTRLDYSYLHGLARGLMRDRQLAKELTYWPNSSLYRNGESWHYVETRATGARVTHHLVQMQNDALLERILTTIGSGTTYAQLVRVVVEELGDASDVSDAEIEEYIFDLIHSEILVSSLSPLLTGQPALDDLLGHLADLKGAEKATAVLSNVKLGLADIDSTGLGASATQYLRLESELASLPAELDSRRLFHTDLTKPVEKAILGDNVISDLASAARLLWNYGSGGEDKDLRRFREAFVERYEHEWRPLLEVLDQDWGIGFGVSDVPTPSPVLRDLGIRKKDAPKDHLAELAARQIMRQSSRPVEEIDLDFSDLGRGPGADERTPSSFFLWVTIIAESSDAVDRGEYKLYVRRADGPSGGKLIGRFCHADPTLTEKLRDYFGEEQNHVPHAVLAEIVHTPEGRAGNIICRPVLRQHEIVYLARSGCPAERQIPASDLLVTVTQDNRILLMSRLLQREVIPRMASAHAYLSPGQSPVYRFLCSLEHEPGKGEPVFDWGELAALDYIPRIRVGRVVLSCRQWRLSKKEIDTLQGRDRFRNYILVQALRQARGFPRRIVLAEGDNTLTVDLDNPLSVDAFVHVMNRKDGAIIREMFPPPDQFCARGPEGRFSHEIIVPFHNTVPMLSESPARSDAYVSTAFESGLQDSMRIKPPGSEWLFAKLYSGVSTNDELLMTSVSALVKKARERGLISKWFFLRYADPNPHLRLRLEASPAENALELFKLVSEEFRSLVDARRIWKLQFDTYIREVERFGGPAGMLASEAIFHADSDAVILLLDRERAADRWLTALVGIETFLDGFGFDFQQRRALLERLRDAFRREFSIEDESKRRIAARFREHRAEIETALWGHSQLPDDRLRRVFDERALAMAGPLKQIQALAQRGALGVTRESLAGTFIHLHVNRLLPSNHRVHEVVLYDFLYRTYDSRATRDRNGGIAASNRASLDPASNILLTELAD